MQEFAPTKSHLSGDCPSDEELAAYIDGVLPEKEAARIAEHLVSCERCYEIYTETVQFLLEDEPPAQGKVVQFPVSIKSGWPSLAQWGSIAALLFVGVGAGAYSQFLASPPPLVATPAAPPLASIEATGKPLWLGPTYRGEGSDEEVKVEEGAFRVGVQLVNLQATLRAENAEESHDLLARIITLLGTQPLTADLDKEYRALQGALDKRTPSESLPEAGRLAKESRDFLDPASLDLGQWVEAAYLAALARNPSFFQQAEAQRFLRRLRWNDRLGLHGIKLDPQSRDSLRRIADVLSKGDLGPSDYATLEEQLKKILNIYYPM